jgi:RNA polymerase primary sigma factor
MIDIEKIKEAVNHGPNILTTKEIIVLSMRCGLIGGREYTLNEIGKEFDLTRERIRQIEAKALSKIN